MAARRGRHAADHNLLLALACGATVENAARSAGVSPATVYRRLQQAEFQLELKRVRAGMVERTAGALTGAGAQAINTLLELLKPSSPAAVRLGAARSIIELGIKLREIVDLDTRIAAVEAELKARTPAE